MQDIDLTRQTVQLLIDYFYRGMFSYRGPIDQELLERHQASFHSKLDNFLEPFPDSDKPALFSMINDMRSQSSHECETDPINFRSRLGTPRSGATENAYSSRLSIGDIVVRSAVRATVWQTIASLFRAFR